MFATGETFFDKFLDCAVTMKIQTCLFDASKDDQTKNKTVKVAPNTGQAIVEQVRH